MSLASHNHVRDPTGLGKLYSPVPVRNWMGDDGKDLTYTAYKRVKLTSNSRDPRETIIDAIRALGRSFVASVECAESREVSNHGVV